VLCSPAQIIVCTNYYDLRGIPRFNRRNLPCILKGRVKLCRISEREGDSHKLGPKTYTENQKKGEIFRNSEKNAKNIVYMSYFI
jgi:hypothetical protein